MRRYNSEGVRREDLLRAIRNPRQVCLAREIDRCMLCRSPKVNLVGLCEGCFANLTEQEVEAARPWLEGKLSC
ncbi:MAG TPA: hypothetical protein VNK96_04540 [Fimbriimonadales bacterium]|nr:hypothetical protein [Fimbriimonadales bacterium]